MCQVLCCTGVLCWWCYWLSVVTWTLQWYLVITYADPWWCLTLYLCNVYESSSKAACQVLSFGFNHISWYVDAVVCRLYRQHFSGTDADYCNVSVWQSCFLHCCTDAWLTFMLFMCEWVSEWVSEWADFDVLLNRSFQRQCCKFILHHEPGLWWDCEMSILVSPFCPGVGRSISQLTLIPVQIWQ